MRVLYVALTRARERLFVVGKARKGAEKYIAEMIDGYGDFGAYELYGMVNNMDVILSATRIIPKSVDEFLSGCDNNVGEDAPAEPLAVNTEGEADLELRQALANRFSFEYADEHLTTLPEKVSVSRLYPRVLDGTDTDGEQIMDIDSVEATGILPAFVSGRDAYESAKRGIATHMLMQFCDLEHLSKMGASAELSRLVGRGFISKKNAELVRLDEVERFRKSALASEMRGAKQIWRELRFNVRLEADEFTEDEDRKEAFRGRTLLVQGVIDCIYEDENGGLHLVDYKTDRLTREELADPALAAEKLSRAHSLQLSYYARAVEKMFGKKPVSVEVYSLPLGDTVAV